MKKFFKNIKFWIKFDKCRSLLGILTGLISFLILWRALGLNWISIIIGLAITIFCVIIIQLNNINKYADEYTEFYKKDKYINPNEIRGYSENMNNILDLDKEIQDFIEKYSSNKSKDYFERELNKQWSIHGKEFEMRANEILSNMTNVELLYTILATERIKDLVDIVDYLKPYKIDVEYLKNHPKKAKEYYIDNLLQQEAVEKVAMNEYFYKIIMDKNYFDEIEHFVLSKMSNKDLIELANSSTEWNKKIYFYGFLKEKNKK